MQVLTHGLGFDKDYWNFGGKNSSYNYIMAATDAGYSTLSYDRIGTGRSSVVDPYTNAQGPIELAVLEGQIMKPNKSNVNACLSDLAAFGSRSSY